MENPDKLHASDPDAKLQVESGSKLLLNLPPPSHALSISVSRNGSYKYIDYHVEIRPGTKSLIELRDDSGRIDFGSGFVFGPEGASDTGVQNNKSKKWPQRNSNAFCFLVAVFDFYDPRESRLKNCKFWLKNDSIGNGGASVRGFWEILENEGGPIGIACNDYHAQNNEGWFTQKLLIYENVPID
jgi:hypothetical protein